MQYMLFCCFDEARWEGMPEAERDRVMKEYGDWLEGARKSGRLRATGKLRPTSTATTLRVKSGQRLMTDGPFAETKEQMGGYHIVECKDLDEAISIASRIPTLPAGGAIEVRPIEAAQGA